MYQFMSKVPSYLEVFAKDLRNTYPGISFFSRCLFCILIPHKIQMQNFYLVWNLRTIFEIVHDSTLGADWTLNKLMSDNWIKLWMEMNNLQKSNVHWKWNNSFSAWSHRQFPQPCPWEASQSFSTSKVICIFVFSNCQIVVSILYFCIVVFCIFAWAKPFSTSQATFSTSTSMFSGTRSAESIFTGLKQ